jgi:sec-independent protein translocase protein TatA
MISTTIFLGFVGPWQWIIIGLAILLLFGGKKLPELMKGLGTGIKEFKNATNEEEDKEENNKKEDKKEDKK